MPNYNNFMDARPIALTSFLSDEIIQLFGIPAKYLPKSIVNLDKLFGEDDLQEYDEAFDLYLLPENPAYFDGTGDTFGNFGFNIVDTMTMYVEIGRFTDTTGQTQPIEHDLVYIPIFDSWFEISFQDNEGSGNNSSVFYWNGKVACFTMELLKLQYSHETIDTGDDEVDDNLPATSNQTDTDNDVVDDEYIKNGLEDEFDKLLDD